jgi:hypothetical protein
MKDVKIESRSGNSLKIEGVEFIAENLSLIGKFKHT